MITARFKLERETKGALRFVEIDGAGEPLEMVNSKIGALYLRKSSLNGAQPKFLEVSVRAIEMD